MNRLQFLSRGGASVDKAESETEAGKREDAEDALAGFGEKAEAATLEQPIIQYPWQGLYGGVFCLGRQCFSNRVLADSVSDFEQPSLIMGHANAIHYTFESINVLLRNDAIIEDAEIYRGRSWNRDRGGENAGRNCAG
jgi:hypothetical protein